MGKFKETPSWKEEKPSGLDLHIGAFAGVPDKQHCHEEINRWRMVLGKQHLEWVFFVLEVSVILLSLRTLCTPENAKNKLETLS